MSKKVAKGSIQVTPEVTMNVELDANNLVDIHVAMKEEALLKQEKELQEALLKAEESVKNITMKLNSALHEIGEEKEKQMAEEVFPALKSFGFKDLIGKCQVGFSTDTKRLMLRLDFTLYTGRGLEAHGIHTIKRMRVPKAVAAIHKEKKQADKTVQDIKGELLKVKKGLASVDRMERRARAQMAIRALESTVAGRKMLAGIRTDATKALPAPK